MIILTLLCLTNGFQVFFPGNFSVTSFLAAYITIPLFFILYLGHKVWARTPWVRPIESVDMWSGKDEADREEENERDIEERNPPSEPPSLLRRIWSWLV